MYLLVFAGAAAIIAAGITIHFVDQAAFNHRQAVDNAASQQTALQLQQLDQAAGAYLAQNPNYPGSWITPKTLENANILPPNWKSTNYWGQSARVAVFRNQDDKSLAWIAYFAGSPTLASMKASGMWKANNFNNASARDVAFQALASGIAQAGSNYSSSELMPVVLHSGDIVGMDGSFSEHNKVIASNVGNTYYGALADNFHLSTATSGSSGTGTPPGGGTGPKPCSGGRCNLCGGTGVYTGGKGCCHPLKTGGQICTAVP